MFVYMLITLATMTSDQTVFKTDQVEIAVNIHSSIFQYRITNISQEPINFIEFNHTAAYAFTAPEGWKYKQASPNTFETWTEASKMAIYPDKSKDFSLRVSSRGAVLGLAPIKIKVHSGETITIPDIWAPSPEPTSYLYFILGMLFLILIAHTAIIVYRNRHRKNVEIKNV